MRVSQGTAPNKQSNSLTKKGNTVIKYIVDETVIEEAQSSVGYAEDECNSIESSVGELQSYLSNVSCQLEDMQTKLLAEQENSLEQFLTVLESELEEFKHRVRVSLESELGLE